MVLGLLLSSGTLLGMTAHPYASTATLQKETALADGEDEVILEVLLMDENFLPVTNQNVYCVTEQEEDQVQVGPNEEGRLQIRIRSNLPGSRKVAISLESDEAALAFLEGEEASVAKIIPFDRLDIYATVHFVAGTLMAERSFFEFEKTTVEVSTENDENPLQGKIYLKTEFNQPVTDQLVLLESSLPGVTLSPASLITDQNGAGYFQLTGTIVGEGKIIARTQGMSLEQTVFFVPQGTLDQNDEDPEEEDGLGLIDVEQSRILFRSYWGLTGEEGIFVSGTALNHEGEPVEGADQLYAYSTFGKIVQTLPIATQRDGSFSFRLVSDLPGQGTLVIGRAKPDVLEESVLRPSDVGADYILAQQGIAFFEASPLAYLWCSIDNTEAVDSNHPKTLEVPPFLYQNRTMMAIRPVAEMMGAQLFWEEEERQVTMVYEDIQLRMKVDVPLLEKETSDGITKIPLDAAPFIREGRTVFPLRHIGEAFGLQVNYEEKDRSITLVK